MSSRIRIVKFILHAPLQSIDFILQILYRCTLHNIIPHTHIFCLLVEVELATFFAMCSARVGVYVELCSKLVVAVMFG